MAPLGEVAFESSWINYTSPPVIAPPAAFDQCTFKRKPGTQVELVAYGLIHPILTIFVAFANINGIIILTRLGNFTQTNMFLLSIFIADLLTTALPLPKLFVQYIVNMNMPQIPHYPWCYLSSLSFPVLPVITNNVSIWFVVIMSIQRYTCVWRRSLYDRIFSRRNVVGIIAGITIFTASFHSILLMDNYRVPLECTDVDRSTFLICNEDPATFIIPGGTDLELYVLSTYYLSRIVIFHVIPIILIFVSTLLLIRILVKAEGTRRRLFNKHQSDQSSLQQKTQQFLAKIDEDEQRPGVRTQKGGYRQELADSPPQSGDTKDWSQMAVIAVSNGTSRMSTARNSNHNNKVTNGRSVDSTISTSTKKSTKTQRISTTTHMLMIISTIYLVQHFFQSILFISGVALNVLGVAEPPWLLRAITVQNLVRWAGFPANFFLCLHVQAPFRDMFYSIYRDFFSSAFFCKVFRKTSPNPSIQSNNNNNNNDNNNNNAYRPYKSEYSVTGVSAMEERTSGEALPLMQRNNNNNNNSLVPIQERSHDEHSVINHQQNVIVPIKAGEQQVEEEEEAAAVVVAERSSPSLHSEVTLLASPPCQSKTIATTAATEKSVETDESLDNTLDTNVITVTTEETTNNHPLPLITIDRQCRRMSQSVPIMTP